MEFLISLYDNALLYYPNVFFVTLFFIIIAGIITFRLIIARLSKKVKIVTKAIGKNLTQIRKKNIKREQHYPAQSIKSIVLTEVVNKVTNLFIAVKNITTHVELQLEKIIRKIGKKILIEE